MILNSNYEPIFTKFVGNVPSNMSQKMSTFGAKNRQDLLRAAPKDVFRGFKLFPFLLLFQLWTDPHQNFGEYSLRPGFTFVCLEFFFKSVPFLNGGPLKIRHLFQPPLISPNLLRFSPNLQGMFTQASHINCKILGLKIFQSFAQSAKM